MSASDGRILTFRPRKQIGSHLSAFRSDPASHGMITSTPMRIDGRIVLTRLLRALATEGLTFMRDERSGELVLLPASDLQP